MIIQPNCPKCGKLMEDFFDDGVEEWICPICSESLEGYFDSDQCPACGSELIVWDEMEESNLCEICGSIF